MYPRYDLGMAALAICQYYLGTVVGDADIFGNHARVEFHRILDSVQSLGPQVIDEVIVGQVAVNAFDPMMSARVKPGLVFRLQDMATAAKLGAFGFGIEAGRPKRHKYPQNRGDGRRNQNREQDFSLGKAHTHLWLEGGRQDQALQRISLTTVPEARHGNHNGRSERP
jgi:hypothetical protein